MQYFGFDRPSFAFKTYGFGSSEFDPMTLFAGGKQGAWYDPSDKSTLFQDVAGTVPVTKDGDPVALMRDKSGNGNHATQTVSASRPIYKTDGILHWLQFDGVDDSFVSEFFSSVLTQPFSAVIASNQLRHTDYSFQFDSSAPNRVSFLQDNKGETELIAGVSIISDVIKYGETSVYSIKLRGASSSLQRNNLNSVTGNAGDKGMGNIFLARFAVSAAFYANMGFYGMVLSSANDVDIEQVKQYLAAKSGVTL